MCGILFTVSDGTSNQDTLLDLLRNANAARGPDAQKTHKITLDGTDHPIHLDFFTSELRLRGNDYSVDQPHVRPSGDVFCWNGEVFEGLDIQASENDGVRLFECTSGFRSATQVRDLFASIEGPYAFVFYLRATNELVFARDPLGRRSLLMHRPSPLNPYFMLASVACGSNVAYAFEDLSTEYIFCLELNGLGGEVPIEDTFDSHLRTLNRQSSSVSNLFAQTAPINVSLPDNAWPPLESLDTIPDYLEDAVSQLIVHLDHSVKLRVQDIPRHSFTGLNTARVAVLFSGGIDSTILAHLAHRHIPLEEPLDLLNVAFENPRKARTGFQETSSKRIKAQPVNYRVPDRVTGLQELDELRSLCPGRIWNFVEVDVPFEEATRLRQRVEDLMFPNRTVMDLSLALALYFASRGVGRIRSLPDEEPELYTSSACVLLNGLGADELLGGYGRHRSAYYNGTTEPWQSVIQELQLDLDRLPARNLGRDDRIISSHGKEARHPFLSMTLIRFLGDLPIQFKTDPRMEAGMGDKLLLRLAARKLGLLQASVRKKRAMQFGSRSARMESDDKGDVVIT